MLLQLFECRYTPMAKYVVWVVKVWKYLSQVLSLETLHHLANGGRIYVAYLGNEDIKTLYLCH